MTTNTPEELEQQRIQHIRGSPPGVRGLTDISCFSGGKARKEYGSVKEFRFSLLEENLDMSVYQLADMFRLSYRQTENIIRDWKQSDRYQEYLRREWNRLYRSDRVPDVEKFRALTTLLKQSMMNIQIDKSVSGNVTVNIRDVAPVPKP